MPLDVLETGDVLAPAAWTSVQMAKPLLEAEKVCRLHAVLI